MQKNLTLECFRGVVRQNELIELGLTNQFDGIDVDMTDMLERATAMGKKFACQFIRSASIPVAAFDLPLEIGAEAARFEAELSKLDTILDLAKEIRATRCRLEIPATGCKVYHENFELLRQRIADLADRCAAAGVSVGLMLQRDPAQQRYDYQFVQKADEILTLIKLVGKKNVGLALDACSWRWAQGSIESLRKVPRGQWIDVQLCDPAAPSDGSTASATARCLPGTGDELFCLDLIKHLVEIGYDGPIAATAHPSQIGVAKPAAIAARLSEVLSDLLARAGAAPAEVAAG
jgi:sugar phosphate isomerase/epimerase